MATSLSDAGLQFANGSVQSRLLSNYIAGLTMSTVGASATMSIAAGQCVDSTNLQLMVLANASKTTASWAVGAAGGLDTGVIANSTWYHFYVIHRPDTNLVDCVFSINATTPALPSGYTKFRRVGAGRTDASAQWTKFFQSNDTFVWNIPVNTVNVSNPGTAAVLATVQTPLGITTTANITALVNNGTSANVIAYISDPATTDSIPDGITFFQVFTSLPGVSNVATASISIRTNTASQIRYRLSVSGAADLIRIVTNGWVDTRGADA